MGKQDEAEYEKVARGFKALGDTLRRAAQNVDALELKPEAKAWLLNQFGPKKPKTRQPVTDEALEFVGEIIRQQAALDQRATSTPGNKSHAETEQRRRKSKQNEGDLPPH